MIGFGKVSLGQWMIVARLVLVYCYKIFNICVYTRSLSCFFSNLVITFIINFSKTFNRIAARLQMQHLMLELLFTIFNFQKKSGTNKDLFKAHWV